MHSMIENSQKIAYEHLRAFGFEEEDVEPLVIQGTKDLEENLFKLQGQLHQDPLDKEGVRSTLHALKGLFFALGDKATADQIDELRSDIDTKESIEHIRTLLLMA